MGKTFSVEKDIMPILAKRTNLISQINDSFEKALDDTISKDERAKYINEVVTNTVALSIVSTVEAVSNFDRLQ